MYISANLIGLLLLVSELVLLALKRSKSGVAKSDDKRSLIILWTVLLSSVGIGILVAGMFPMANNIPALFWGGVVLFVFGAFVRWAAIYQLGKAFTVDVAVSSAQKIKEDGLYKLIRHPSYLGLLMEFAGLSFLFNSCYTPLVVLIPTFCALNYRIKVEEKVLSDFFGADYQDYKMHTKRIIPYIW